jgi:hypothetical protein
MHRLIEARLSVPVNGWMGFDLQMADNRHTFWVSYTPNDFLDEIVTALSLAAKGIAGIALAHTEPTVIELAFSPDRQSDLHSLKVTEYPDWGRRIGHNRPLLAVQGSTESVVVPFWRSLRRLQSEVTPDEYRERMRREFPTEHVHNLSKILGKV